MQTNFFSVPHSAVVFFMAFPILQIIQLLKHFTKNIFHTLLYKKHWQSKTTKWLKNNDCALHYDIHQNYTMTSIKTVYILVLLKAISMTISNFYIILW